MQPLQLLMLLLGSVQRSSYCGICRCGRSCCWSYCCYCSWRKKRPPGNGGTMLVSLERRGTWHLSREGGRERAPLKDGRDVGSTRLSWGRRDGACPSAEGRLEALGGGTMRAPWAERGREGEGASQGLWPVLVRIRCLKTQIVLLTSIVSFLFRFPSSSPLPLRLGRERGHCRFARGQSAAAAASLRTERGRFPW